MPASSAESKPCNRCKAEDGPYKLRNKPCCGDCFVDYVQSKTVKRLAALVKEVRASSYPQVRRYVVGLSFGPSSRALVNILDSYLQATAAKKGTTPFEVLAIHIDTDLSHPVNSQDSSNTPASNLIRKYQEKFTNFSFRCVPLSKVLEVQSVDWSALLSQEDSGAEPSERLRNMFDRLPSVTARADILRLLIRHLLLHIAMQEEQSYTALLLGNTTTSLAALSLAEVANGRGFSIPWQVNDGWFPVPTYNPDTGDQVATTSYPVYYVLREIFKAEISTYVSIFPDLVALQSDDAGVGNPSTSVVSHKDTSIEEVMTRYFDSVEGSFSGIVSNVVRMGGKLDRAGTNERLCGLCSVALDERGDSRWAGEMGDEELSTSEGRLKSLCHGCKRSVRG